MHLLLLQQKKAINHLDFIKLKLKPCACDGITPFKMLHVGPAPPFWIDTHTDIHTFSSSSCPHQTHTRTTPTLLRPYYAGQKCPSKNVSQFQKKKKKEEARREKIKKILCPSTSEGPEGGGREGEGERRREGWGG